MLLVGPPADLPLTAWRVAAVTVLMAVWWISEALPLPATALLPLVLFPLLGVAPMKATAAPYAHPLIFLFLGGFIIALAFERWELHRRVALSVLRLFGSRPPALVAGFMVATAILSMWVSNTATALMMLPIGLAVIALLHREGVARLPPREDRNLATSLLLAIAYGASIGGVGTLIGTPPNAFLAAHMEESFGRAIGFGQWMLVGIPVVLVMLPLAWLALTRLAFPVGREPIAGAAAVIGEELRRLGPMKPAERRIAAVFALTAVAWMLRPVIADIVPALSLSDPLIAVLGALAMFVVPAGRGSGEFLMNWETAKRLPWGVLILFGGGLSLASAIADSGLAAWIGETLIRTETWPLVVVLVVVTTVIVVLTEITSNTATTAVFLPLAASFAVSAGSDPLLLAVPVALAASCAFMLPVATPPNAIVFGSGHLTIAQMVRAGLILNLIAIVVITAVAYTLVLAVFGIDAAR